MIDSGEAPFDACIIHERKETAFDIIKEQNMKELDHGSVMAARIAKSSG